MYALVILMFVASSGMSATTVQGFQTESMCKEAGITVMSVSKADTARAVCVKVK